MNAYKEIKKSDDPFFHFVQQASDPFQFLAKYISNDRVTPSERIKGLNKVPVTQDASASAYQIMSYLLLNAELGRRTNLLPSPEKEIQDIYISLKDEFQEFLNSRLDNKKFAIIESRLTRKLIKQLFMPLIYGKTVMSMSSDIHEVYGSLLSYKDNFLIAQLSYEFWKRKYPDIDNFMKLLNQIGWFCSALGKPVQYSIPYFTTMQDYMRSQKAEIWVYDRVCKKKRRVTIRVPTYNRDKRKTKVSTCVNFIHQKDAFIAMKVVEEFTSKTNAQAPIYTVHDNFITTSVYAAEVPKIYTKVFMDMGPPLRIINYFIYHNLTQLTTIGELSNEPNSDWLNEPIPSEYIRTIFYNNLPNVLSYNDKLKWDNKIDETVSCYEEYVNTVCGDALPSDGGMRHAEKWNEFHSLLKSWESLGYNYSLHY